MKLSIKREAKSSMLGGKATYSLVVRAQLEGDEADVIKKNSLGKTLLVWHEKTGPAESVAGAVWKLMKDTTLTVDSLVSGTTFTCKDVSEMIGIEEQVRASALNLRIIIEMARQFGGEELIDVNESMKLVLAPK